MPPKLGRLIRSNYRISGKQTEMYALKKHNGGSKVPVHPGAFGADRTPDKQFKGIHFLYSLRLKCQTLGATSCFSHCLIRHIPIKPKMMSGIEQTAIKITNHIITPVLFS